MYDFRVHDRFRTTAMHVRSGRQSCKSHFRGMCALGLNECVIIMCACTCLSYSKISHPNGNAIIRTSCDTESSLTSPTSDI